MQAAGAPVQARNRLDPSIALEALHFTDLASTTLPDTSRTETLAGATATAAAAQNCKSHCGDCHDSVMETVQAMAASGNRSGDAQIAVPRGVQSQN